MNDAGTIQVENSANVAEALKNILHGADGAAAKLQSRLFSVTKNICLPVAIHSPERRRKAHPGRTPAETVSVPPQSSRSKPAKTGSGKRPLTFGAFVASVYRVLGRRRAKGIIHLAVNAHLIEFCGTERFRIS
jgi:hypothetical protein